LQDQIERLGLVNKIHLLGYLSDKEKIEYFQIADLVIVPSEDLEGFGIVNLEALACNTPVMGTRVAAIPETLDNICNSLLVDGCEKELLAKKIEYFLNNQNLFENKRLANEYVTYSKKYDWDLISDILIKEVLV